ncbi:hypothetical protein A5791_14565 [Mycobacterium sp. 852002-51163_SCH5372311]|uniref:hypothetical protein n=1 Tax=Mycobacterium sp. 852002-51163_SCH5372311 TaxID=1834097 RepID=UPI0008000B77|nr:hypothetical protein [Mycobacterium sp. 852002-51163_SCH5372311]OBF92087.1 hypothetical protein A5791_14565 [Mycobacterium sp. 852002-51163_SCH5372311]
MSAIWSAVVLFAACSTSQTASPPAGRSATSTSATTARPVAAPAPATSPLAKDWKSYGGTVYFGCPEGFSSSKSALEDIRPKIFDIKTGQFTSPAIPAVPAGETVTGGVCALSNTADDMKVVYIVVSTVAQDSPGHGATKTTAYLFDLKSERPLATKELQPPAPDLSFSAPKEWRLGSTISGVAWVNAFSDGHGSASPPRTVILSNTDLSMGWTDPQPGRVWQDALAFQRNTMPGKTSGAELRLSTGEAVYQDNDIEAVEAELSEGSDKLVKITRRDPANPSVVSTIFWDVNTRAIVKLGDSDRISGSGLAATLSDGKLLVDARGSDNSQFGFGVWNLRTQQWDLLKTRDEAAKLSISKLALFGDRLYVTYAGGTLSVLGLPTANTLASTWSVRPFGRISGWTLVCRGETPTSGECKEIVLVQDENGHYPGPWI